MFAGIPPPPAEPSTVAEAATAIAGAQAVPTPAAAAVKKCLNLCKLLKKCLNLNKPLKRFLNLYKTLKRFLKICFKRFLKVC